MPEQRLPKATVFRFSSSAPRGVAIVTEDDCVFVDIVRGVAVDVVNRERLGTAQSAEATAIVGLGVQTVS